MLLLLSCDIIFYNIIYFLNSIELCKLQCICKQFYKNTCLQKLKSHFLYSMKAIKTG